MMHEVTLQPGTVFGGHEVVRRLGTGTFGSVYEALRLPIGRRVALKVLHPHFAAHAEVTQRFLREAQVVAQLEHPNIVSVIDLGVHDGLPFITMQFLEGETLAERLQRGALSIEESLEHILPILSAVATAHDHGIVHRDLKPENIFLERLTTGRIQTRLLDFGIAKIEEASLAMTGTSAMMGTPYYMPPEQVAGAVHADARSDIWALGAILFEMVSGAKPFQGASMAEVFASIVQGSTPSVRTNRPDLPVALDAVIARALAKTPALRWQSAQEFAVALLPLASPTLASQWEQAFGAALDGTMVDAPASVSPQADITRRLGTITTSAPPPPPSAPASTVFAPDVRAPSAPASTVFAPDVRAPSPSHVTFPPPVARPPPASGTAFLPHGAAGTMVADPPSEVPPMEGTLAMDPNDAVGMAFPATPSMPSSFTLGMPPGATATASGGPPRPRRRLWLAAVALGALLVLIGGGIVVAMSEESAQPPPSPAVTLPTAVPAARPPRPVVPIPPVRPTVVAPAVTRAVTALVDAGIAAAPAAPSATSTDAGAPQRRRHRRRREEIVLPVILDNL